MTDLEIFKRSPLFAELNEGDRAELFRVARTRRLGDSEVLCYENDLMEKVYFLIEGRIKSYKVNRFDNEILLFMQKECGMITLYMPCDEEPRYFSNVESVCSSLVMSVSPDAIAQLCKKSKAIERFFLGEFARKYSLLKYIINRDLVFDGTAKVAFTLENNIDDFNAYKKQEVAYMLNIQPETLSRILTKMKRDGYIEENGGKITVRDHSQLKGIYEI